MEQINNSRSSTTKRTSHAPVKEIIFTIEFGDKFEKVF